MSVAQLNEGGDKIVKKLPALRQPWVGGFEAGEAMGDASGYCPKVFEAELVEVKVARCGRKDTPQVRIQRR